MRILAIILFSFVLSSLSIAQAPLVKEWDYRFGGTESEFLFSFKKTSDQGYLLGGHSNSGISGDKTAAQIGSLDFWLVKLDSLGNKLWDNSYGSFDGEQMYSVQETSDGGYIMGGWSASGIGGDKSQINFGGFDYWIIKIDSLGNKQWDKTFGGDQNDALFTVLQTSNNNYIVGGWSQSGISGNKAIANYGGADYWLLLLDSVGNKIWENVYGGTGDDVFHVLKVTNDGGFILGGFSDSGISGTKTQASFGDYDYWIQKIDVNGNVMWDQTFGGTKLEVLIDVQQTEEGGFIMGGVTESDIGGNKTSPIWGFNTLDYWIIKTDSLGNKEWEKDFGGTDHEDDFGTILQTQDKGYIMSGCSYSNISGNKTENNLGVEQAWVIRTDSLGNILWDKTIATHGHVENSFIVQTDDNCYAIAQSDDGGVGGFKSQPSWGLEDYWIVRFCDTTTVTVPVPQVSFANTDTNLCGSTVYNFIDSTINNPNSWQWFFPGALPSSSNIQNPQGITYSSNGIYSVTLIACNQFGCDSSVVNLNVTVLQSNPMVNLGPDLVLCDKDSVQLTATAGYNSYLWFENGNIVPTGLNSIYADQQGVYALVVIDSIGCTAFDSVNIQLIDLPQADFDFQVEFNCNGIELYTDNKSLNAMTYLWNFGDGNISNEINPVHIYPSLTDQTIELVALNDQCSDTVRVEMISFEPPDLSKVPNVFTPNNDLKNDCFRINGIESLSECFSLKVFNRWGSQVYQTRDPKECWSGVNDNGTELSEGVYIYKILVYGHAISGTVHLMR